MWTPGQGCLGTLTFLAVVTTDHLLILNRRTRYKFLYPSNKPLVCRIPGSGQNSTFMYFHFVVFLRFRNCSVCFHAQFWKEGIGCLVLCVAVLLQHLFVVVIYGRLTSRFPLQLLKHAQPGSFRNSYPNQQFSLICWTIDHVSWLCSRGGDGLT